MLRFKKKLYAAPLMHSNGRERPARRGVVSRLRIVAVTFRCLGAVVLLVAVLHLYATILIREHVLARIENPALRAFVSPGYLLDHVVVGIFMLPMGFLMLWSYGGLRDGQRWAYVMNWSFALSILATPFAIAALMTDSEFRSPAFALAAGLMALVGIASCAMLLWARAGKAAR